MSIAHSKQVEEEGGGEEMGGIFWRRAEGIKKGRKVRKGRRGKGIGRRMGRGEGGAGGEGGGEMEIASAKTISESLKGNAR